MKPLLCMLALMLPLCSSLTAFELFGGYVTTAYDYTETANGAVLDTERSDFTDINGGYGGIRFALNDPQDRAISSIELYLSHSEGPTRYVGSELGSGLPYGSMRSTTYNSFDELRLSWLAGVHDGAWSWRIHTSAGYYQWERELSREQVETYAWGYGALGGDVAYRLQNWEVGAELRGFYAYDPRMKADIPSLIVATFDLGETSGFTASMPVRYRLNPRTALLWRIAYENIRIGRSNVIGGYYEPDSEQKNWHSSLGLEIAF